MNTPCNGCTLCCQGDAVRLLPFEIATFAHEKWAGIYIIAHQANGDCYYLNRERGCAIQSSKPSRCQEMDCRNIYAKINGKQAREMHASGILKVEVWQKGKALTREYGKPENVSLSPPALTRAPLALHA